MPTEYKILGQSSPSSQTNTTLYTVPSATQTIATTLSITNRSSGPATYRVAARPDGESIADKHYLAYDAQILANDSVYLTMAMTMNASDVISIYSSNGSLSFTLFGSEMS